MAVVAVVADDDDRREVMARIVEHDGHVAHRIAGIDAASELLQGGQTDLAVLDLTTGGPAASRDLLATVRHSAYGSHVRAVLVGRSASAGLLAWQAGADGFLVRPYHSNELCRAIDEALARGENDRSEHRRSAIASAAAG